MTDTQKLVYDLSLQCAALDVQRNFRNETSLEVAMLHSFIASVQTYACMDSSTLANAVAELKKI